MTDPIGSRRRKKHIFSVQTFSEEVAHIITLRNVTLSIKVQGNLGVIHLPCKQESESM